jgi:hypothetical protein
MLIKQLKVKELITEIEALQNQSSFFRQDQYLTDLRDELETQLINLEEGFLLDVPDYLAIQAHTESLGRKVAIDFMLNTLELGEALRRYQ